MKKINHKLTLIILLAISICTLSVGITYSKFVFKQDIERIIDVPEYNQCLSQGVSTLGECVILNENDLNNNVTIAKTDIKKKTAKFDEVPTTDEGLYMAEDDNGESYYYRGNAVDNYVSYAGFIWRIVRVNGDGTVRMIYAGTTTLASGEDTTIGTAAYNSTELIDMTFVGYKYGLNQQSKTQKNAIYNNLNADVVNVHANKISCDNNTKLCTLNDHVITEPWSSGYLSVLHWNLSDLTSIWKKPKYTCWGGSASGTCNLYMEVSGRTDDGERGDLPLEVSGTYTGYISKSYNDTLSNDNDSTIKSTIDSWYVTNIQNKLDGNGNSYASYIADTHFCNDRSLSSGDGNGLSADSVYASYNRNTNSKTPSLKCSQSQDRFTTTTKGNGNLTYPIGLITADELAMSGVVVGNETTGSYLNTGVSYWTMSPGYFSVTKLTTNNYMMNNNGLTTTTVNTTSAVRPVINLSTSVKVTKGNGTITNPYQVSLN